MKTGSPGTFVISWTQTETDGRRAAPLGQLVVGAAWCWTGAAVRVDQPYGALLLHAAEGAADIRERAARVVRRLLGDAVADVPLPLTNDAGQNDDRQDQGFILTDGHRSYTATLITGQGGQNLLMFVGEMPPAMHDLWVVRVHIDLSRTAIGARAVGGVICFTPDTCIATPDGPQLIQRLQPGDRVLTKDNGPQDILWVGHRRFSGARLHAMPHLRPVRFKAGALCLDRPDQDLLVSPQHRVLVKGRAAVALFNTPEVLVAAEDLINDTTIIVDHALRDVTYVHLLLAHHNIVFANGLETETYHPANTALDTLDPLQRAGLLGLLPGVASDPHSYGDYVRRNLSGSEAAILRHDLAA